MKKIIFILLILLATPVLCLADNEGQCGDNAYWVVSDDTMTIYGTGEMYAGSMSGSWFMKSKLIRWDEHKDTIKNIVIEEGITHIAIGAFARFSNLQSIQLPDTLINIHSFAFYMATNLQEINIPSGVKYIGNHAFYHCSSLTRIKIPDGINTLRPFIFSGCSSLSEVELPETLQEIGCYAFYSCKLQSITIPSTVTRLGGDFDGDSYGSVFSNCSELSAVYFTGNAPVIFQNCFLNDTLTAYYPADNLTYENVIANNYGGTVSWVASSSLCGHSSIIVDDYIAPTCTSTGLTEGQHCYYCNSVIVPQEIIPAFGHIVIEDAAVDATCSKTGLTQGKHCKRCGEILVPQQTIPMKDHHYILDPAIEATCSEYGLTLGIHCNVCGKILVAQTETPMKEHTVVEGGFAPTETKIGLAKGSYCSVCGTIISCQTLIPALQDMDVLYLPESISDIASEAFSECLCEAVIIPDGCESVGDNAFRNCSNLIYVKIPSSVVSIGENAFADCCTDIFIDTVD